MENEPQSLNHFAMMHGLYLGFALILNQLAFYLMGIPFSEITGLLTYAIIISGTFILYKYIEPGMIDKMLVNMEEKLIEQGWKDEAIEKMLGSSKSLMTPGILAVSQVFSVVLLGFLFSLILAIFFKKEPANPFYGVDKEEEEYE